MTIVGILEFITSALVIVTLYLIPWSYKWWLAYAANSILFAIVSICRGAPWFGLMGLILCITAIKNYIVEERKKEESKEDEENPIS